MSVRAHAVFVTLLAMFAGRSCMLLGFFLLAHRMVPLGLMMMGGSMMASGGEVMVFTRRVMLGFMRR